MASGSLFVDEKILQTLKQNSVDNSLGLTAADLCHVHAIDKKATNQALHRLLTGNKVRKIEGYPPRWMSFSHPAAQAEESPSGQESSHIPLVVLDLGNCHFIPELEPYVKAGLIQLRAYADLAYNGPRPDEACAGTYYYHADEAHKNTADVQMIWELAQMACLKAAVDLSAHVNLPKHITRLPRQVIVVTKDQGFRHVGQLISECGCHCEFVSTMESLKLFID